MGHLRDDVLKLARGASIDLLDKKKPLTDVLLVCKDISRSVHVYDEGSWVDLELNGYLVKYKTIDELRRNLPPYRRTDWRFYDVYENVVSLPPDIIDLFGRSVVYHPLKELESSIQLVIENKFLERFNQFIADHGMDYASKSVRIREARVPKHEIDQILNGIKNRAQEFLDVVVTLLEID